MAEPLPVRHSISIKLPGVLTPQKIAAIGAMCFMKPHVGRIASMKFQRKRATFEMRSADTRDAILFAESFKLGVLACFRWTQAAERAGEIEDFKASTTDDGPEDTRG